jgi:hypothetical protein
MVELPISKELAAKLQQLAREEKQTLEDMLTDFINKHRSQNVVQASAMREFAEELEKLNPRSGRSDIATIDE